MSEFIDKILKQIPEGRLLKKKEFGFSVITIPNGHDFKLKTSTGICLNSNGEWISVDAKRKEFYPYYVSISTVESLTKPKSISEIVLIRHRSYRYTYSVLGLPTYDHR